MISNVAAQTRKFLMSRISIFLSDIAHFRDTSVASFEFVPNGGLVVKDGLVLDLGASADMISKYPDAELVHHEGKLILPGFIDTHVHFAQGPIIASWGEDLLGWLDKYAFPAEMKTVDKEYSAVVAREFLSELLQCGTTTANVFGTVHKQCVEAFFEEAEKLNLRMICGKVMMDRVDFAPEKLRDTAQSSYDDSVELIEKWHGKGRLSYAVIPRFAITSTEEQLQLAGKLLTEHEGLYLHTHLNENKKEIQLVRELFGVDHYCSVYKKFGLLSKRSIMAHCVHMEDAELTMLVESDTAVSTCPTSNLFLGSGLFDRKKFQERGIRVGLGTDVGGGTSYSQLHSLNEAYKVCAVQGDKMTPLEGIKLATIDSAVALSLDHKIGNFLVGKEADFIVIDKSGNSVLKKRMPTTSTIDEQLFLLMMLGDDRAIAATYILGSCVYSKSE